MEKVKQAEHHFSENRIEEAIAILNEVIQEDASNIVAHNDLGVIYLRLEDAALAEANFKKALELDPGSALAMSNLAVLYQKLNRFDEALAALQKLDAISPGSREIAELISQNSSKSALFDSQVAAALFSPPNLRKWLSFIVAQGVNFLTAYQVCTEKDIDPDRPNIVLRHDVDHCPLTALHIAALEKSLGIRSTFYIFPPEYYMQPLEVDDFIDLEKQGFEIGYHSCTEDEQEAMKHLTFLRKHFDLRTTLPHMGNMTICNRFLHKELILYGNGNKFMCGDHGYINDNGSILRFRGPAGSNTGFYLVGQNEMHDFVKSMKPGNIYHLLFHPVWYVDNFNFTGKYKTAEMGQGLVQISAPAKPGGPAKEPEPKQTEIAKDITAPGPDNHAIFVGGTGRSGTTLLINLLGSHPQIASTVTETKLIGHDIFRDFPKILHGLPMNQRKDAVEKYKHIWVNQFYKFKIKPMRPDDDGFRGLYVWLPMEFLQESLPILDKAIKAKTLDEICLVHGEFMNSFMMKYAKSKNKIHWAEKTPLNGQYSHMYYKWFPNLRAVNIVRDARDVAMSHQNVTWGIKDHIQAIDWWGQTMKAIMEAVRQTPQRNCLTIRYEDLVTRPEMIKCRLLRFLDLPENPDDFNFEIRTSSVGYWREKLPKHAADYAVQKYGNLLKYLGYQVD